MPASEPVKVARLLAMRGGERPAGDPGCDAARQNHGRNDDPGDAERGELACLWRHVAGQRRNHELDDQQGRRCPGRQDDNDDRPSNGWCGCPGGRWPAMQPLPPALPVQGRRAKRGSPWPSRRHRSHKRRSTGWYPPKAARRPRQPARRFDSRTDRSPDIRSIGAASSATSMRHASMAMSWVADAKAATAAATAIKPKPVAEDPLTLWQQARRT